MSRVVLGRVLWIGAAAVLGAAALVAIAAVVRGEVTETDGRILASLGSALLAGGCLIAGVALAATGRARIVGWAAAAVAPVALAVIVWVIWSFEGDGEEELWKALWSAALVLVTGLLSTTALLLARRRQLVWAAAGASVLVTLAAGASIAAIWAGESGDAALKAIATLWILGVVCWFLVPVLGRLLAAPPEPGSERILAVEGEVELVATRAPGGPAIDARLEPGERLVLRRRPRG